jgi:hypothetical protein
MRHAAQSQTIALEAGRDWLDRAVIRVEQKLVIRRPMQHDPRSGWLSRHGVRPDPRAARQNRDFGTKPHDMLNRRAEPGAEFDRPFDAASQSRRAEADTVGPDRESRGSAITIRGRKPKRRAAGQIELRVRIDLSPQYIAAADKSRDKRVGGARMQ